MKYLADYGHSSIENAISVFKQSNSKQLILSHHKSDRLYKEIKQYEDFNIYIAREGQEFKI